MKKIKFFLLSITFSFLITSCAGSKTNGCGYWSHLEKDAPELNVDNNTYELYEFCREEKSS